MKFSIYKVDLESGTAVGSKRRICRAVLAVCPVYMFTGPVQYSSATGKGASEMECPAGTRAGTGTATKLDGR